MKILLADPPARGTKTDDSYPNLGLLYLAGSLRAGLGDSAEIAYLGPKHDLQSHVQFVKEFRPDVYGIGFTSKSPTISYKTMRAVREACPDARIVAGGPHPTALPMDAFHEAPVDAVVLGEGETTFTELVQALAGRDKPDLEVIRGIVFRRDGQCVQTPSRPLIEDLDSIAFPAWDLVDFRQYSGMHLKKQPVESSLVISRGCPFYCSFCSQPIWKYQKPWLRARSVENICKELDLLYERGVREVYLSSDELNFNERWATDLCKEIAARKYRDLYLQCNVRADKVSPSLVAAMAEANCWLVHLGVESANDRVLQGIGKHVKVAQIEEAARQLSSAGIKVFAFMMLYQAWEEDGRLCCETTAEVDASLQWARRMFKNRFIHYMSWQFTTPLPGARLFDIARRHSLYRGDAAKIWEAFDEHNACLDLPGIAKRTMQWRLKKGILMKDWFILRSGGLNIRHVWRAWENMTAMFK